MNEERAILKGHLSDLKKEKTELDVQIDANLRSVKRALAAYMLQPISEVDIDGALVNLREAKEKKDRRTAVMAKIAAIEKELAD